MRYFDLHCDTMTECTLRHAQLSRNSLFVSLERAAAFRPWVQVFAAWMPDSARGEEAMRRFDTVYATFRGEMESNAASIRFCRGGADLKSAAEEGKNAAFLSIEGGAALNGDIGRLYNVYEKGVRLITLTWNGPCELGDGCMAEHAGGLTEFGREAVRAMEKLGMVIDVSHLSTQGFYDVAQETKAPFVASHSNAKAVCTHPRNLEDWQLREIIRRGGLIGLNLYPPFVSAGGKATLRDILPHAEHIFALGGERSLAIGADFDGADMPDGVSGIEDMAKLYETFAQSYNKAVADGIFFDHAYNYFLSL